MKKGRCIKTYEDSFGVRVIKGQLVDVDSRSFKLDGDFLCDINSIDGQRYFKIVDDTAEVNSASSKPMSFEITSGKCNAYLCKEEFDFWDFDVENIDDVIAVATKAKELYEEHFKTGE